MKRATENKENDSHKLKTSEMAVPKPIQNWVEALILINF
jgi:hypothetical protein